jgi:cyclic pyranopterin monophosphate synthase
MSENPPPLSHVDARNQPTMVDVSGKRATDRTARAEALVRLPASVRARIVAGDIATAKGPVFQTAIVAGTMAAKRTHELIPFCHPLALTGCRIELNLTADGDVRIGCEVRVNGPTGVEMEALTGASVAALTVYDMCKALAHDIVIADVRLLAKTGGKSDYAAPVGAP